MMMETDPSSGQLLEELRIESKMVDFSCYNHHRRRTNLKHINWKRIITLIICMEALMDFGEEYGMQLLSTIQYNLPSSVQIETTAVYSQVHIDGNGDDDRCGAKLCLEMRAKLLPGDTKATPISLAQHSYFNLASHSSRSKIFDHTLHLPNCSKFTPLDGTSIPTREVQRVDSAGTMSMDFRKETLVGDALLQYAEESADQDHVDAIVNVQRFMASEESDMSVAVPETGGPFGFDHNYVINQAHLEQQSLRLAAVLSHPPTDRSLSVLTTAPGMQTYTSNYLDGTTPPPALCKDNSRYCRWQGICLETQTYPDSIIACDDDDVGDDEFSRGRCFILRPGGGEYIHAVQYEFRTI